MRTNNNILFLLHLPPPIHGSSIVGQKIKESKLINNSFRTRYINLLISRTVDESGKTKPLKIIRFIESWFKLLIELIKERPNLCYFALSTTGSAFLKDVTLVSLLKLFRVKTIFHLHNKGIKNNESNYMKKVLYQYVFKKNKVILLSNYLYDDIKTFVAKENTFICPNGVEDILLYQDNKSEFITERVQILFLSNLIRSKGVLILIEACQLLQQKGYNFTCNLVGGEGDIDVLEFQKIVEKFGVAVNVKYLGKKYGNEKDQIYKMNDIFVLPTSNDCFPLVLLEAMQYSLPVVSTNEGGIPDIVESGITGFLLPTNNAIVLANKLEVLLVNKSLRDKMGKAGREKYEKEFTLQTFETNLQQILYHQMFSIIEKDNE